MSLLTVGSVGIDNIITEEGSVENALGGSASYASVAAGFFNECHLVGIVGDDFPEEHVHLYKSKNVDIEGLEIVNGEKTFRWTGKYHKNFVTRETLDIQLNVFETFRPKIPANYINDDYILLANIDPELQLMVLDQVKNPKFIAADTMDLWLNIKLDQVKELLKRVNLIVLNDEEARQFSGETNLIKAGKAMLAAGPEYAIVKKGEHGAMLFTGDKIYQMGAFPLTHIADPTGAGDSFIGGLMGFMAFRDDTSLHTILKGMAYGTVAASFTCSDFSLNKFREIGHKEIQARYQEFKEMNIF